ncbi:MAG: glycosyltransferase family 2 protein [Candidatus Hydrogenedentota bacterium]
MTTTKHAPPTPTAQAAFPDGLCAVIPCYNAGPRLAPVLEALRELSAPAIVIDDGSAIPIPEETAKCDVELRRFPTNRGKGHALLEGFEAALQRPAVDCIAVLDADGQHDPRELPALHRVFMEKTADLVIGSRRFDAPGVPWNSRLGNALTARLSGWLLGVQLPDTQCGYRLHSRRLVEAVLRGVQGGRYETEMEILVKAIREGYTVVPAPIQTIYETGNPSSHFRRVGDSIRVYRRLFAAALRRAPRDDAPKTP